jgi:hypothetical protein
MVEIGYNDEVGKIFAEGFLNGWRSYYAKEKEWVDTLRQKGVTAAHPDDGWVDRDLNEVILCYPQFNDGVNIGSIIALGDCNQYRLVKIVGLHVGFTGLEYWKFEEVRNG